MEKKKKILIGLIISLCCICVASIGTIVTVLFVKKHNNHQQPDPIAPSKPTIITSSYNEAITSKLLTTQNYSGTYTYDNVVLIKFNDYSEDNPTGITEEEKKQLYIDVGITRGGYADFCMYMSNKKYKEFNNNNKKIEFVTKTNSATGEPEKYGSYKIYSNDGILTGLVYGDENLAVGVDTNDKINIFMSINYNTFADSIEVSDTTHSKPSKIYIFEDYYSKDNPEKKLFIITYQFKLISNEK